jgi:hypothetical protein
MSGLAAALAARGCASGDADALWFLRTVEHPRLWETSLGGARDAKIALAARDARAGAAAAADGDVLAFSRRCDGEVLLASRSLPLACFPLANALYPQPCDACGKVLWTRICDERRPTAGVAPPRNDALMDALIASRFGLTRPPVRDVAAAAAPGAAAAACASRLYGALVVSRAADARRRAGLLERAGAPCGGCDDVAELMHELGGGHWNPPAATRLDPLALRAELGRTP